MAFEAQEYVDRLMAKASLWDIHTGKLYFSSSDMDLNHVNSSPDRSSVLLRNLDTSHDIRDVDQFKDWMASRAKQCVELSKELRDYRSLAYSYPDFHKTVEGSRLVQNYSERAMMALYGVDEGRHKSEFSEYVFDTGDKPYACSQKKLSGIISEDLESDHVCEPGSGRDNINDLIEALQTFSDRYSRTVACERSLDDSAGVEVSVGGISKPMKVYSSEMLNLYMAEVCGRQRFFARSASMSDYEAPSSVSLWSGKDMSDVVYSVVDKAYTVGYMAENCQPSCDAVRMDRLCYSDSYYALDSMSVVRAAERRFLNVELEKQKEVQGARDSSRDMSDVQSACDGISGDSGQPDYFKF